MKERNINMSMGMGHLSKKKHYSLRICHFVGVPHPDP